MEERAPTCAHLSVCRTHSSYYARHHPGPRLLSWDKRKPPWKLEIFNNCETVIIVSVSQTDPLSHVHRHSEIIINNHSSSISGSLHLSITFESWNLNRITVQMLGKKINSKSTAQFSSVAQSCLTLCNPMDGSMPGLPVNHQLQELAQTHVHQVSDAIQPSHPPSPPSLPTFSPSQH